MKEQILSRTKPLDGKANKKLARPKTLASIIVAVRDSEDDIQRVHDALMETFTKPSRFSKREGSCEFIFVDDGSLDGSWNRLKKIANGNGRVKLVRMRTSFGEAAAFDAGLKQATGEKILFFTTRVRINPAHLSKLLARLDDGCDLVMGWRHPRRDSKLNQFISRGFNAIIRWISKLRLQDVNSGVFAARKQVLEDVPIYGNMNIFLPILASRKGYRVGDEPIEQLAGKFRQSKYVSEYVQRLLDIVTVVFLTKYSKKPLHFLGFLGFIFTIVGLAMNVYLFIYRVLQFGPIAGRPLLLLGALLLVIGIQMISIGLIGEMIIFTHAREIKEYTIEEILE